MFETLLPEENLNPFLTGIGWLVGYTFDADDWTAIRHGIRETDAYENVWFEYEFHREADSPLKFGVAFDESGGSDVRFRSYLPARVLPQVELLVQICTHFRWHERMLY